MSLEDITKSVGLFTACVVVLLFCAALSFAIVKLGHDWLHAQYPIEDTAHE